jgi:hypothetical protein
MSAISYHVPSIHPGSTICQHHHIVILVLVLAKVRGLFFKGRSYGSFRDKFAFFVWKKWFLSCNYILFFKLYRWSCFARAMKYWSSVRFSFLVPFKFLSRFSLHAHVPWNTGICQFCFFFVDTDLIGKRDVVSLFS